MDHRCKCKMQKYKTQGNIEENVDDFGYGNHFSDTTPKAWPMKKEKFYKLNLIKIKNFCCTKKPHKTQLIEWKVKSQTERRYMKKIFEKGLLSKYTKNS